MNRLSCDPVGFTKAIIFNALVYFLGEGGGGGSFTETRIKVCHTSPLFSFSAVCVSCFLYVSYINNKLAIFTIFSPLCQSWNLLQLNYVPIEITLEYLGGREVGGKQPRLSTSGICKTWRNRYVCMLKNSYDISNIIRGLESLKCCLALRFILSVGRSVHIIFLQVWGVKNDRIDSFEAMYMPPVPQSGVCIVGGMQSF